MKKISKKISPRKGGWPTKDRTALVIRPESKLLALIDQLAVRAGCSRSRLIEQWLSSLIAAVELADSAINQECPHPQSDAELVGLMLVREIKSIGVLHEFISEGLQMFDDEQRRMLAQIRADKAKKGRAK